MAEPLPKSKFPELRIPRKRYFDEGDTSEDVYDVLESAALLDITEFRLFQIAYNWSFGATVPEEQIEAHFIPYMFEKVVPSWVKSFTSQVLQMESDGGVDPEVFGIFPEESTGADRSKGRLYALYLVTACLTIYLLAELAVDALRLYHCTLPPCY